MDDEVSTRRSMRLE